MRKTCEKAGDMVETRLLGYERAVTATEIALWANDLLGQEAPGSPGYIVMRVIQFQLVPLREGYDALLLVEVEERSTEARMALRESDVAVIERLTSSIDEEVS